MTRAKLTPREETISNLDLICKSVFEAFDTLYTDGINTLNYDVRKAVDRCYKIGITRWECEKVLLRYVKQGA